MTSEKQELLERILAQKGIRLDSKPLVRRGPRDAPALSFAQERLWFIDQLQPGISAYNLPAALQITGALAVEILERAIDEIICRHEVLRTTFESSSSGPVPVIHEHRPRELPVVDLESLAEPERDREARRLAQEEGIRPFDLRRGPVARTTLLRSGPRSHLILYTLHHIVSDGWSRGILNREIGALYDAFCVGLPAPLKELPLQYVDFALWQRQWLQGEVLAKQLAYWRERLNGLTPLQLPVDRPRLPVQSFHGAVKFLKLDQDLTRGLRELFRREEVTLFMTYLAGLQVVLSRYASQNDVPIGVPIANRNRPEIEGLIGCFVNTLVLRGDLSGDPTVKELLRRVKAITVGAFDHQDLPFEKLVEELQPERDLSRNPLVQVVLELLNAPDEGAELNGLILQPFGGSAEVTTRFDLEVHVREHRETLTGWTVYNADVFESSTISRMMAHLERVLVAMVQNPDARLSELEMTGPEERRQILEEWNTMGRDYSRGRCVHERFEEQARMQPGVVAVRFEGGELTYGELNERANRLARYLRGQGVGPEDRMGLCVERSVEMIVGLLGIVKAGAAYVPLDPAYPVERLAYMAADAGVRVVLTQDGLAEWSGGYGARVVRLDRDWEAIGAESGADPVWGIQSEQLMYVIYTSGSTGRPKGVLVSHRNVARLLDATEERFGFGPRDVWTLFHSYAFDFSVWEIWGALAYGGRLVVVSHEVSRSPERFYEVLKREGVTVLNQTPSAFGQLQEAEGRMGGSGELALRHVIFGGEALDLGSLGSWYERHGDRGPQLVNMYGITETTVHVTYRALQRQDVAKGSMIGRAIGDLQIYIADGGQGLCGVGVPGEIYVGGAGLARGYHGRADLTAERFVPEGWSGEWGRRVYRTGDKARYLESGDIEYLGRIDQQVKIRGFRIELGEIESVLREEAAVDHCVVVARTEPGGDRQLAGYVVARQGQTIATVELKQRLRLKLPDYMVPSAIVVVDKLSMTLNGKIDHKALPIPEWTGGESEYVAPKTPFEEMLAGIWQEVLKLKRVGVDDDFFEIGGHSLLATQVISRMRERFRMELPLRSLFEARTIVALARRVQDASVGGQSEPMPVARSRRGQEIPLSFAQERLWFIDRLDPGSAAYHVSKALKIAGALRLDVLERAVNEIVRRHEVLRTTYEDGQSGPVQVIHEARWRELPVMDLSGLAEAEQSVEARRLIGEEGRRPFDLVRGPVVRMGVLRLGDEDHVILHTLHHIGSDGWSMDVINREMAHLYEAYEKGQGSPLAELAIQYADYAEWQRQWMSGEVLAKQLAYWKGQLAGVSSLQLPTDHPRPALQSFGGGVRAMRMGKEVTAGLKALGQREGVTLFMVLAAGLQALLSRYSGQKDVAIGMPIANRNRRELEELVGCLVNTLVLRTDLSGDPTVRGLLERVKEVTLGAYGHQDLPFEKLVTELQPERDPGRNPLFQASLTFHNTLEEPVQLTGMASRSVRSAEVTTRFDLEVHFREFGQGLEGQLVYNASLFESGTIEGMVRHLERVFEFFVAAPGRRLSELPLLTDAERQRFVEWNDTAQHLPGDKRLHELFAEQAAGNPDSVAVACEGVQLSYRQLNERANQVAHRLRGMGVGPEVLVGVCMERSIEMVVGLLAILKAGAAYVPLDPGHPMERLAFMLRDAGVTVLLTQERLESRLPSHEGFLVCLHDNFAAGEPKDNPESKLDGKNLAYVIYTSGSTGQPKGVEISHESLLNLVWWHIRTYDVKKTDRATQMAGMGFDASTWELWPYLAAGASLHIVSDENRGSSLGLRDWLVEQRITVSFLPTPLAEILMGLEWPEQLLLRQMLTGGDRLGHFTPATLPFPLINHYGPTESTVVASCAEVSNDRGQAGMPPIGRPIANTQLYVLDEHLNPVPAGVAGELHIGGAGLARGYLNGADSTAEKFIANPFSRRGGERMYRTGDLGRFRTDGQIEFLGRKDEQVKLRGYRIELGEIESALRQHDGVQQCVVVAREKRGGGKQLVGYVVGDAAAIDDLNQHLRRMLPEYMVPAVLVALPAMPLTSNGKVDRRALPPPENETGTFEEYVAPRNPIETVLAEIWAHVLKLERVGVLDNFFELGGDSILSLQIIARANNAGLKLKPRHLFENQTIARLAVVAADHDPGQMCAEQNAVSGPVLMTPIQQWFFGKNMDEPHHYNQSVLLAAREGLDAAVASEAVDRLVNHHDALRLRYQHGAAGWEQRNAAKESNSIFLTVDLSGVAAPEQSEIVAAVAGTVQASLRLDEGPLLRVVWFDLGAEIGRRLFMASHHLAIDGVSWRILLDDLQRGCRSLMAGRPMELGAKTTSFQQWASHLQHFGQTEQVERQLPYWEEVLRKDSVRLPVDFAGGTNRVGDARTVAVTLDREETRALLQQVPEKYRTQINDVLLTAVVHAVGRLSGQYAVLVNLEGHGREDLFEDLDVTRTVGWFTTVYPVRLEVDPRKGLGTALKQVKEQLRAVPHRGIGYGLLRYLNQVGKERLKGLPEAEIGFNYLGQFDQVLEHDGMFRSARERAGDSNSPRNPRMCLLEVSGSVVDGRLRMGWAYSREIHKLETIELLAAQFLETLRGIIAHCSTADAGGFTPSDFPLAQLNQEQLDAVWQRDRAIEDVYVCSPMQQGLLFHSQYAPGSGLYFEQLNCRLEGPLRRDAFRDAWQAVVNRHSILRTAFWWDGLDRPHQIVHRQVALDWVEQDWRQYGPDEQRERLEHYAAADRRKGFDHRVAPLMRFALLQLADDAWQFVWSHHHALLDGWCISLLVRDVLAAYERLNAGGEATSNEARPYREYIAWLQQQDVRLAENFWRGRLEGFDGPTPFGIDRANRTGETFASEGKRFSPELSARLQAIGRQHQLTMNTIVQGTWALLLSRYSGSDDVVFGTTVSGRPPELSGMEEMVGLFINTLPVRIKIHRQARVVDWLKRVQDEHVELREYEYSSLVDIQGWSEIPRGAPLFESILVFENYPVASMVQQSQTPSTQRFRFRNVSFDDQISFPLGLTCAMHSELQLVIRYDCERFEKASIARMMEYFERVLECIATQPEQCCADVEMLSAEEREQILGQWNLTQQDYPREKTFPELFEEQVERSPDAVAVVCADRQLTYRELNERANGLAHHLRSLGVGPEVLVALCMERCPEMILGLLGILKTGGAYLPVDPGYPLERTESILRQSGASVVLTQTHLEEKLPGRGVITLCLDTATFDTAAANPNSGVAASNLAYVIFTSGSTGEPKGVMIPHQGLTNYLIWAEKAYQAAQGRGTLVHSSIGFDLTITGLFLPLIAGQKVILAQEKQAVEVWSEAFDGQQDLTLVKLTPAHLKLLEDTLDGNCAGDLTRAFVIGGEALNWEDVAYWRRIAGRTRLINEYGPTETVVGCCICEVTGAGERTGPIPIGRPIANTRMYVLDRNFREVPTGVLGELFIGGDGVARGYINNAAATAERFVPNPFGDDGRRLYRTGDLGYFLPNGNIQFVGRRDGQVKIRGFRIELGEIENVLRLHGAVLEVVVAVVEEQPGDKRFAAYVVSKSQGETTADELQEYVRRKLPAYMIPSAWVMLDRLPLTVNGKIDRKQLPLPGRVRREDGNLPPAPRTPTEILIIEIWSGVLKVENIGTSDNFFDLGGHSLLATQVISRVKESVGVELPLRSLFEAPTLAAFAELVARQSTEADEAEERELLKRIESQTEAEAEAELMKIRKLENENTHDRS